MLRFGSGMAALGLAVTLGASPTEALDVVGGEPGSERSSIARSVDPRARAEADLGAPSPDTWMDGRTLGLRPGASAEGELERLLEEQQRFGSPLYRTWLTPDEYGRRFGASDADLLALIRYLEGRGLRVEPPPRGRGWIQLSGTVDAFERAFETRIRRFALDDSEHLANAGVLSLPSRLAALILPGSTLASVPPRSLLHRAPVVPARAGVTKRPEFTDPPTGRHVMSPFDFATIYNVAPLGSRGITGKGVSIAVPGTSNVDLGDIRRFRTEFGLAANDPHVVLNGSDPGKGDAESEADLDLEWAGAIAPDADVSLVLTGGGGDTLFLSAGYAVDQNIAAILALSFGSCEDDSSRKWDALWKQAAAQGISVFASAGDSGCSCDNAALPAATGVKVNGIAASPYAVCVGGTEFSADVADPGRYWSSSNDPKTGASALSYIPEAGWNESGQRADFPLFAGGGGYSGVFSRGTWQTVPGLPADDRRAMPDVALSAAAHTPYFFYSLSDPALFGAAGTSASTPAFAGIAALVSQAAGSRLGNMSPRLYELGRAQYERHEFNVFHDVVEGNNSVPGATGYECGPAYDLVTGLGSVDAAALVSAWTPAAAAPCTPDSTSLCLNGGRFRVTASWKNNGTGDSGHGHAVPLTGDTGYFWFFTDNNIELVVKALDGRPVNGKYWLFYGALSDVEYSIDVTDTTTGLTRSYFNPQGRQASVADTSAF
jgi:subtilase family serine protease